MITKMIKSKRSATHIFLLCWLVYAFAYFSRMNISILLPELQNVFGWSKAQVGLIGSGFFWIYGAGHFINGTIGDRVSGRWFIFIGTLLIAGANILFGFAGSLSAMILIWSLNGYFQSMIWSPMIKILSNWYDEGIRHKVSTAISTSMAAGYLLAWGLTGFFIKSWGWQAGAWIPGLVMLVYAFIWLSGVRDQPVSNHVSADHKKIQITSPSISLPALIKKANLSYLVFANMTKGIVKEGITLWGPLFIMEKQGFHMGSSIGLLLVIPLMNLFGFLFAGWLADRTGHNDALVLSSLFVIAGIACYGLLLAGSVNALASVLLLGLASAMLHGTNILMAASIPMKFKRYNRTSSVAGLLDSSSYLAAGVSASLSGFVIDKFGWSGVMVFWTLILTAGVVALVAYSAAERKVMKTEVKHAAK